jgi:hypothetical protein
MDDHACAYRQVERWSEWIRVENRRERAATRVPICDVCGGERPARRPRRQERLEVEAAHPSPPPMPDDAGRRTAAELLRRVAGAASPQGLVSTRGLTNSLVRRGIEGSLVDQWLETLMSAGWLRLHWRLHPAWREITHVRILDPEALEDFAHPGARRLRQDARTEAWKTLAPLDHPLADEIAQLIEAELPERESPEVIRAVASLAVHVASGDIVAERVFSVRYLGDSKALGRVRRRIESLLGPLERLGIREAGALVQIGGRGAIRVRGEDGSATRLDLATLDPYLGLPRDALADGRLEVELADEGLVVIENFACFEAFCRGEVEQPLRSTVAWTAGYPGRAIRRLVEVAAGRGAPIRAWADLDLDGVRIARLVDAWSAGTARFHGMTLGDLRSARRSLPLTERAVAGIRADLERHPDAPLADLLRALLEAGRWVEQEAFLG